MSKVIKRTDLIISSPKIVKAFGDLKREVDGVQRAEIPVETAFTGEHSPSHEEILEEKRRDLELIKEESAKILEETEDLVKDIMAKARDEARGILNIAQDESEVVRNQALQDAEAIKRDAYEQAYREGLRLANEAIESDRQMAMEQSRQMIEEGRSTKFDIIRSTETDMVRLIMAISKKIINHEITCRPELIVDIVRQAVSYLDSPEQLKIYVNPRDMQVLVDTIASERLVSDSNRDIPVDVKTDNRISPGGCIVESGGASVDATIETRTAKVEGALSEIPGSEQ